ncbi:MAG TPA: transcription antitermination factor NusB [Holophagaceae bacterium]|jgi:16S rRNA (cytosine967-C5)-methyltransferase|nr:transcription antitermination factor NusB [Holophagaceae bacterium]
MATHSRRAVARALHAVFGRGERVPERWDQNLSGADASLAQALLGASLRHWGAMQAWALPKLKDPKRGLPAGSQVALSVGLAQLAWLEGVAPHAAVNEAVDLAADAELGFPVHKGLVNALLRKASQDPAKLRTELAALGDADRTEFAAWVLESALAPRGQEARFPELWARVHREPRLAFRVLRGDAPEGLTPDPGLEGCWRLTPEAAFPFAWLREGAGMVQDASSQALMQFQWDPPVTRILDACAAPGGKTTALGLRFPDAVLTALERSPRRAERLRENLVARRVSAEVIEADAAEWLEASKGPFDLILLDAPCSGSGTLQKHPELAWIGGGLDLRDLAKRQRALLEAGLKRLAPGGLLIYAVCSWFREEGLAHRDILLAAHPELRPAAIWDAHFGLDEAPSGLFLPDPLVWEGEGFQAFALTRG